MLRALFTSLCERFGGWDTRRPIFPYGLERRPGWVKALFRTEDERTFKFLITRDRGNWFIQLEDDIPARIKGDNPRDLLDQLEKAVNILAIAPAPA
jgi:hypothetical protein